VLYRNVTFNHHGKKLNNLLAAYLGHQSQASEKFIYLSASDFLLPHAFHFND